MKQLKGVVVSIKMDKTAVIKVERIKKHPLYEKRYKKSKKYKVHDEKNQCKEGQMVLIEATKPISRHKKFKLVKVLEQK